MIDYFLDLFRSQFSCLYVLVVIPVALSALSPPKPGTVQEFKAFRLQHFDLAGNQKGSRAWRVSFDATSLDSNSLLRRCLVVSWRTLALSTTSLNDLLPATLGAVLILIPPDLVELVAVDKEAFVSLEERLLESPFTFPIYFSPETRQLGQLLEHIELQKRQEQGTAVSALLSMVIANSYHIVNEIQASSVVITNPIYNIVGKLSSFERSEKTPTILLVAHYDSFGSAPALSFGADSNGSGVVALLELLRIFSRLYESSFTRAKYNLVFLLSAAGKLKFIGSRQFVDDYAEQLESSSSTATKPEFVLCLDSLLSMPAEDSLYMHVSKLPRNGSSVDKFYTRLQNVASKNDMKTHLIAKKINLGDEYFAWEHERYSIHKLFAFTISHHQTHKNALRRSILDVNPGTSSRVDGLVKNVHVIAEALLEHVFRLPLNSRAGMFNDLRVDRDFVESWFDRATGRPRAQQNFTSTESNGGSSGTPYQGVVQKPRDELLNDLFTVLNHYANEAYFALVKTDKRDPEFVLYGATFDKLLAYTVKPAVFDLILAIFISGYLGLVYLLVLNASVLQHKMQILASSLKKHV